MRKRLGILAALFFCALLGSYLMGPRLIRGYVERRLPAGVTVFGPIQLEWKGVRLHTVKVERGWAHGDLAEVWVSFEREVKVQGGLIWVDLDARSASTGGGEPPSLPKLTASGLEVEVQRKGSKAFLHNVRWDGQWVCWGQGDLTLPWASAQTQRGCYHRDGDLLIDTAAFHLMEPIRLPGLGQLSLDGHLTDIRVSRQLDVLLVQADKFDLGPLSGTELTFNRLWADGLMYIDARTLTLQHPWLAPTPSTFHDVYVSGIRNHTARISVGTQAGVEVNLETQTVKGTAPCQEWVRALPDNLRVEPLRSLSFTGDLTFEVGMTPRPHLEVKAACRVSCQNFPNLRTLFTYQAYRPDGARFERRTGPGTPVWLPLSEAGQVPLAVIQMEDPGFPHHRGYLAQAFQNSLIEDVQKGRFSRGGSTITQQTAKNLWLTRDKTIGRKVQELLLAQAMESCLTKDEILAIYLNIVEFGPDQYGLADGTRYWFHKTPAELTPVESFWLARILPAPRKARPPVEAVLQQTERLMQNLAKQGKIPDFSSEVGPADATDWDASE